MEILDQSPQATAIYIGDSLVIEYANKEMLKIWCSTKAIIGQTFTETFPTFKESGFSDILENIWKTGISYSATDTPAEIQDGDQKYLRYFDFEYRALLDQEQKTYAILHTAVDVTSRVENLKIIQEKQEQLSFNKDLQLMATTLAHDAKNPLSIARLGVKALQGNPEMKAELHERWLKIVSNAMDNLNNIIDKTVQLGQAKDYKRFKIPIKIDEEIQGWFHEASQLHEISNVSLDLGELFPVFGDRGGIAIVFINILGNALKYSAQQPSPRISITSEQSHKGTTYFIRDNGIGIPPEELSIILAHSARASNTAGFSGQGLGLYIVRRIMERLRGYINLSSRVNVGTEVILFFPCPQA